MASWPENKVSLPACVVIQASLFFVLVVGLAACVCMQWVTCHKAAEGLQRDSEMFF